MSESGETIQQGQTSPRDYRLLDALASAIPGGLCRCVKCCCKPGTGHYSPQYAVYEAEMRAVERYEDAKESGLSEYEAREEGWPEVRSSGARAVAPR